MSDCLFCQIVEKKAPADIVYEDDIMMAFKDIYPKAPVHLLLVPKIHIASLDDLQPKHADIMGKLLIKVPEIAAQHNLDKGYRTIINTGADSGQIIFHIHIHILGGSQGLPGF